MQQNAIYAQSGGVTAVINASASGVLIACREHFDTIGHLYAAENGILGVLHEELIDTTDLTSEEVAGLRVTPGGAFGSCRYKLKSLEKNRKEYQRLIDVFAAHNIGYFFYNGGNDSADTCLKVAQMAEELKYPLKAIHIPKTIDNDLVITDNCPGFGSVAKYVATSVREAGMDLHSMYATSTKVFILEVMGRNAGWIAASSGLASFESSDHTDARLPPHMILFPEVAFDEPAFISEVKSTIKHHGYCVIVASEGIKDKNGMELSASKASVDAFGHKQLGGVAPILAEIVNKHLQVKTHWAVSDYLQRSARHIASGTDVEQAYSLGYTGVKLALQGKTAVMPSIIRTNQNPYQWEIVATPLAEVANHEKFMPRNFISSNGFHITQVCREYLEPLIWGEDYPPYAAGLPMYVTLKHRKISKKLAAFSN